MKNDQLINNLSKNLSPWEKMDSLPVFTLKWVSVCIVFLLINLWWMPFRADYPAILNNPIYQIENVLWVLLALFSSTALYKSSFPDLKDKKYGVLSLAILGLLLILAFTGNNLSIAEQIPLEMQPWRGGCGFIISFIAVLGSPILALYAKRGAPSRPGVSGVWAAISSASVGCFLMQFGCSLHTSMHLLIWHFIPIVLMSGINYFIARKILRW